MRTLTTLTDPQFTKKEKYSSLDQFFLSYIKDERDLPFVYLCLTLTFVMIPFAVILFTSLLSGWMWTAASVLYLVMLIYYLGPFTLMLHNTSHRMFFKREYLSLIHI